MRNTPLIKLEGVSKYYKTQTGVSEGMRNIDLEFNLNEFVAITGESGSGKTTLLNVISGLDSYEDGELYINGLETSHFTVKDFEELRAKNIGFVFQNYNVIDSYTVYQNVVIALEAQGYDPKKKKARALELIEKVGLLSHKNQKTAKLSGGQKQRVVIARALAKNAPIILADEPTGNLDSKSGREIMELLKEISKDKLIILVTHNYEEAKNYITRNIIMSDGNVKEDKVLVKEKSNYHSEENQDKIQTSTKKANLKNSFLITKRNMSSTPRKTLFSFLLALLSFFILIFSFVMTKDLFNNNKNEAIEKTLYIQKKDNSEITKGEFNKLKQLYETKDVLLEYSVFNDSYVNVGVSNEPMYIANSSTSLKLSNYKGVIPRKEREIVISNRLIYKEGDTITLKDDVTNTTKSFQIVGTYADYTTNSSLINIYFSDEFIYDDNGINEFLINKFRNINTQKNEIRINTLDRIESKDILNKLSKSDYNVFDPYRNVLSKRLTEDSIALLVSHLVAFIALGITYMLTYIVKKNLLETKKHQYSVYRSLGTNSTVIRNAIIIEEMIQYLFSGFLLLIVVLIIGTQERSVRLLIREYTIFRFLLLTCVFMVFSIVLGTKFNRKIYNQTVIDSLKEEES